MQEKSYRKVRVCFEGGASQFFEGDYAIKEAAQHAASHEGVVSFVLGDPGYLLVAAACEVDGKLDYQRACDKLWALARTVNPLEHSHICMFRPSQMFTPRGSE